MADWLSFIIFALLFYFMMRHGCGSHKVHSRHDKNEGEKHLDPVCGKQVDIEKGYGKMHAGILYRFCSRKCLDQFEVEPDKYLNQSMQ